MTSLRVYNADKASSIVKEWYEMIKDPIDDLHLTMLKNEACEIYGRRTSMCEAFQPSFDSCIRPASGNVTAAECTAVKMYTSESAEFKPFYDVYNKDSHCSPTGENILQCRAEWAKYKVYTKHLWSAVKKLANSHPLPKDVRLYRGLNTKYKLPDGVKRIYWTQFTSTSLDKNTAYGFGTSTQIIFKGPRATVYGGDISKLSWFYEKEVLIPPFEAFDVLERHESEERNIYVLTSSSEQEVLGHTHAEFYYKYYKYYEHDEL